MHSPNHALMPYSVREPTSMSSESFLPPGARNLTDVFAVHGADPEVLAYAMAKYSRSSLSMRESLTEISVQRAEQFLNTFYFQYGHRSIADWPISPSPSSGFRCWPRLSSSTNRGGTARNGQRDTRIF